MAGGAQLGGHAIESRALRFAAGKADGGAAGAER